MKPLTKSQLEELKCPKCNGKGKYFGWINPLKSYPHAYIGCDACKGTGNNPITIQLDGEKCKVEWEDHVMGHPYRCACYGSNKIYKEKEGDEIKCDCDCHKTQKYNFPGSHFKFVDNAYAFCKLCLGIKLKILSIDRKSGEAIVVKL